MKKSIDILKLAESQILEAEQTFSKYQKERAESNVLDRSREVAIKVRNLKDSLKGEKRKLAFLICDILRCTEAEYVFETDSVQVCFDGVLISIISADLIKEGRFNTVKFGGIVHEMTKQNFYYIFCEKALDAIERYLQSQPNNTLKDVTRYQKVVEQVKKLESIIDNE